MSSMKAVIPNPQCWPEVRFRFLANVRKGKLPAKTMDEKLPSRDETVPYLSMDYLRGDAEATDFVSPEGMLLADAGDILLLWDGSNAGEFMLAKAGAVSSTAARVSPVVNGSYFYWLCKAAEPILKTFTNGMGIPHVDGEFLANMRLPFAQDEVTQRRIADYLGRETARIDALVSEKERMLELLDEKRAALISRAVTQGLDPTVKMKASGFDWLGEVPEGWETGPLKRYWNVTDCKHVTAEFVDDGIPLASIREVQARWVELENAKYTTEHFYELLIEGGRRPMPGDLIFSRNATVGEVAQVHAEHPRFAMGQDVVLLRKRSPDYSSDFLQYVIRSPIIIQQLANLMIGSTFKRINVEEIRTFMMPCPPSVEQAEIAAFLEEKVSHFDALTAEVQSTITFLAERRAALITAAVTGQIPEKEMAS